MVPPTLLHQRLDHYEQVCAGTDTRLNRSHQRQVVYQIIAATDEHPTAETIFLLAQRQVPSISVGTVYKNIHLLVELGLVREVPGLKGPVRYDANTSHHHHFACQHCGAVVDLPAQEGAFSLRRLKQLRGAQIHGVDVLIHGVCATCSEPGGKSPKTKGGSHG